MIFALRQPAVLVGLLLGFLLGVAFRAGLQRRVGQARRSGGGRRRGRLRAVGRRRTWTPQAGWAAYLDPYGGVAALLAGVGWGARPEPARRGRATDVTMLCVALAVHGVLAAAGFAAYRAANGSLAGLQGLPVTAVLHGSFDPGTVGQSVSLGFAMINLACGLLALVPIPPMELGVVLWSRLPRSPGARRLAYRVLEEQWGIAVILLLLLLPLAGQLPVLLSLINTVADPLLARL